MPQRTPVRTKDCFAPSEVVQGVRGWEKAFQAKGRVQANVQRNESMDHLKKESLRTKGMQAVGRC